MRLSFQYSPVLALNPSPGHLGPFLGYHSADEFLIFSHSLWISFVIILFTKAKMLNVETHPSSCHPPLKCWHTSFQAFFCVIVVQKWGDTSHTFVHCLFFLNVRWILFHVSEHYSLKLFFNSYMPICYRCTIF